MPLTWSFATMLINSSARSRTRPDHPDQQSSPCADLTHTHGLTVNAGLFMKPIDEWLRVILIYTGTVGSGVLFGFLETLCFFQRGPVLLLMASDLIKASFHRVGETLTCAFIQVALCAVAEVSRCNASLTCSLSDALKASS